MISTAPPARELDFDALVLRLIEAGHGTDVLPALEQAISELATAGSVDDGGFELDDVLDHMRATHRTGEADRVEEGVLYLVEHGAPVTSPDHRPRPTPGVERYPGGEVRLSLSAGAGEFPPELLVHRPPSFHRNLLRHELADDDDILREEIGRVKWFHSYDFGNGVSSAGTKPLAVLEAEADLILPMDLQGRSVLDIGSWDGFFSVQAARRGAARVLATDHFCWNGAGWGTKAGFNLAKRVLAPQVEELEIDVPDVTPEAVGRFDVVMFLGVLYHLPDPHGAIQQLAGLTREVLVMETQMDMLDVDRPAAAYYPGTELNDDETNWWAPNVPCAAGMLHAAGFQRVYFSRHPTEHTRGIFHAFR